MKKLENQMEWEKRNPLQKLDPRCKILMMASISTGGMLSTHIMPLLAFVILAMLTLLIGKMNILRILNQLKGAIFLIGSLFLIQCLFVREGGAFLQIYGTVFVTYGGFHTALLLSLRFLIVILSALIVLNGEPRDYLLAMVQCKLPYEVAFMVMAAFHFLPVFREEAFNVYYSVQLRGTELKKTSLVNKIKLYGKMCLPILIGTLCRGKAMAIAMEARGLRAMARRTYMRTLRLAFLDKILMLTYLLISSVILAFQCFF